MNDNRPWFEKYRPNKFEDIVLEDSNKTLLNNIIATNNFPNLLFYGPPGTGKTTTIINMINSYQIKHKQKKKGLMIHLNASDDRGIDIIRNQINSFVNTKTLFGSGVKFVILDEVDYMTKNAQQALRYLIQQYSQNIRFCLICNYISKIDSGLQNEFIKIRFNDLPKEKIIEKLKYISDIEELNLSERSLENVQLLHKSDMRSMINFIQLCIQSKLKIDNEINIINDEICRQIENKILVNEKIDEYYIYEISLKNNIEKNNLIKIMFNYIIKNRRDKINSKFLNYMENVIHCLHSLNDKDIISKILNDIKKFLV